MLLAPVSLFLLGVRSKLVICFDAQDQGSSNRLHLHEQCDRPANWPMSDDVDYAERRVQQRDDDDGEHRESNGDAQRRKPRRTDRTTYC